MGLTVNTKIAKTTKKPIDIRMALACYLFQVYYCSELQALLKLMGITLMQSIQLTVRRAR